jgi:hypothetical protein
MLIEQIDVLGATPPQRALDRFPDMRGPAVSADDPVAIETPAELDGDHYFVAPTLERPA